MFFPNTVIAETLKMLIEQLSIYDGIKMVKQVVLIRVNLIVYPIDHIAVNHIALDSIPNARENIYSNRIVCIIQPIILIIYLLYSETGWWFINIDVHTYFTERIWQVTCLP
jgi:succinate dehydrogenase hydrophobic anchor subunit